MTPTPMGSKIVEVEFEVRTHLESDDLDRVAAVLNASTTLRAFHLVFGQSTGTISVYTMVPTVLSSTELSEACGRWYLLNSNGPLRSRHCMAQAQSTARLAF